METFFNPKLNRVVQKIYLGELFCTTKPNMVLSTLVGSCVCVCLADKINGIYGINHFMLPEKNFRQSDDPRYGEGATNLLIIQMLEKGANRQLLEAKVFGAGKLIENENSTISKSNADFIEKFLDNLKIPIILSDLGGNYGRVISYFCDTQEVIVEKISNKIFLAN